MSDAPEESADERESDPASTGDGTKSDGRAGDTESAGTADGEDLAELRRAVEEKYDFENFGPADMAEMTLEEWELAFDPETWITGEDLLDRVEDDLAARVANREVFARVERQDEPPRLVAYSDEGYAVVYPDGSVTGEGTVLRDVKPSVALCSMDSFDVPEPPDDASLPTPEEVPEQSGELGNLMLQVIAGMQVIAALVLLGAGVVTFGSGTSNAWLLFAAGFGFLIVGLLLFFTVANARLSDAFRAEEYRNRLRAVGTSDDDRPDFLPPEASGEGGSTAGSNGSRLTDRLAADDEDGGRTRRTDEGTSDADGETTGREDD